MSGDWTPVVVALLTFLGSSTGANLVVVMLNRRKLQQVHENTNGSLQVLRDEVARLGVANDALQAKLERLLRPPGPI